MFPSVLQGVGDQINIVQGAYAKPATAFPISDQLIRQIAADQRFQLRLSRCLNYYSGYDITTRISAALERRAAGANTKQEQQQLEAEAESWNDKSLVRATCVANLITRISALANGQSWSATLSEIQALANSPSKCGPYHYHDNLSCYDEKQIRDYPGTLTDRGFDNAFNTDDFTGDNPSIPCDDPLDFTYPCHSFYVYATGTDHIILIKHVRDVLNRSQ
jgi:hypothetical protein